VTYPQENKISVADKSLVISKPDYTSLFFLLEEGGMREIQESWLIASANLNSWGLNGYSIGQKLSRNESRWFCSQKPYQKPLRSVSDRLLNKFKGTAGNVLVAPLLLVGESPYTPFPIFPTRLLKIAGFSRYKAPVKYCTM